MKLRRSFTVLLAAGAFVALLAVAPHASAQDTSNPAEGSTVAVERETQTRSADAESERDIRRIVMTLIAIGLVMAAATVVFWRATRPVAPELDRLAVMGSRGFQRARPYRQRELLGRSPFERLERLQRGESLAETNSEPRPRTRVPPAAAASAVPAAAASEGDPSLVEADPAMALERPVIDEQPPDEAVDEEASAGPLPG
jgi:hypothetical protein